MVGLPNQKVGLSEPNQIRLRISTTLSKNGFTLKVTQEGRYGQPVVKVALKGLRVLKTTKSAFVNFVDDEYRYF